MWGNALTHLQVISADGQAIGAGASEDKNVFELYRSLESSCRRLQTDVETAQRDTLPPASVGGCGFRRKGALRPRV
jgi:hypothetical protein